METGYHPILQIKSFKKGIYCLGIIVNQITRKSHSVKSEMPLHILKSKHLKGPKIVISSFSQYSFSATQKSFLFLLSVMEKNFFKVIL